MLGTVELRLKEYLDARNITRYELSKKTEIGFQTIDGYYKNITKRYDGHALAQFCHYLDCQISDLLVYIPAEDKQK